MKISILSFYSGHVERGVENWAYEMASRLAKNNTVTVFQNGENTNKSIFITHSVKLSVQWEKKNTSSSFLRRVFIDYWSILIARFTLKIFPILWSEKFDIVIPTNGGWQTLLVKVFTWVRGGKMVIVGHSGPGWDDRFNLSTLPDCFVALSRRSEEWAKKINPFVKTTVIHNGVDLTRFTTHGSKAKVNLEHPIILAVGALEKSKRLHLAIEAVSKLGKGSLLILGDGSEKGNLNALGLKLLGKKRFEISQTEHKDIANYYRAGDIFTLPSWEQEAFGMVYLEAMACDLPVVATDDELRHEIIGDAGILVDPTDTEVYANALENALNTKWGNKSRKQAENFSWDTIACEYEKLFLELLQ